MDMTIVRDLEKAIPNVLRCKNQEISFPGIVPTVRMPGNHHPYALGAYAPYARYFRGGICTETGKQQAPSPCIADEIKAVKQKKGKAGERGKNRQKRYPEE